MKKLIVTVIALSGLLAFSLCWAGSDIPNLVGEWSVKAEGGAIVKGGEPGAKSHHRWKLGNLEAEVSITSQKGRIIQGTFKSSSASEKFIAAISQDNKNLYCVDEDGFLDGKIINNDTIEVVYRHSTPADTVLGTGLWTRKK